MNPLNTSSDWETSRDEFVAEWGTLGTYWGINRTMAQIHALLMTAPEPLSTDEVMEKLQVSRGNAHTNLKELVSWKLLRIVTKKGERREFFEAEKDLWTIFATITRERRRREIEPAVLLVRNCAEKTKSEESPEGKTFHQQMKELDEFLSFGLKISDTVIGMRYPAVLQWAVRLMG